KGFFEHSVRSERIAARSRRLRGRPPSACASTPVPARAAVLMGARAADAPPEASFVRRSAPALAISLAAALALFSGLARGIPRVYDLPDHLGYTWHVLEAFHRGDFYPRWFAFVNDGFGEATLVFYPPVLHWTSAAIAALFGGDILVGLYVTLFLFAVLG